MNKSRFGLVPIGTSRCILQDARNCSRDNFSLNAETRRLDLFVKETKICLFMDEYDRVIIHHIPIGFPMEIGSYYDITVVEQLSGGIKVEQFSKCK